MTDEQLVVALANYIDECNRAAERMHAANMALDVAECAFDASPTDANYWARERAERHFQWCAIRAGVADRALKRAWEDAGGTPWQCLPPDAIIRVLPL